MTHTWYLRLKLGSRQEVQPFYDEVQKSIEATGRFQAEFETVYGETADRRAFYQLQMHVHELDDFMLKLEYKNGFELYREHSSEKF